MNAVTSINYTSVSQNFEKEMENANIKERIYCIWKIVFAAISIAAGTAIVATVTVLAIGLISIALALPIIAIAGAIVVIALAISNFKKSSFESDKNKAFNHLIDANKGVWSEEKINLLKGHGQLCSEIVIDKQKEFGIEIGVLFDWSKTLPSKSDYFKNLIEELSNTFSRNILKTTKELVEIQTLLNKYEQAMLDADRSKQKLSTEIPFDINDLPTEGRSAAKIEAMIARAKALCAGSYTSLHKKNSDIAEEIKNKIISLLKTPKKQQALWSLKDVSQFIQQCPNLKKINGIFSILFLAFELVIEAQKRNIILPKKVASVSNSWAAFLKTFSEKSLVN
jgi:hypothetical protein